MRITVPRAFVAIAIATFVVLAILFASGVLVPGLQSSGSVYAATAVFSLLGAILAWRSMPNGRRRRAWLAVVWGTGLNAGSQLYALLSSYHQGVVVPRLTPADIGFIAVYPCFVVAAWLLFVPRPKQRLNPEIVIDASLLTLTAVAWTYSVLVKPVAATTTGLEQAASLLYATGGLAVIWVIGMRLLRMMGPAERSVQLAVVGLALYAICDLMFGIIVVPHHIDVPWALDLGWNATNLLLGVAGAIASADPADLTPKSSTQEWPVITRVVAVVVALGGLVALHIHNIATGALGAFDLIVLIGGGAILAARFGYSLFADRQYEGALEREVERQTHTLLDSLGAAANAERNLRLIIEASPDPIMLLDREGRVLSFNPAAPAMVGANPERTSGRAIYEFLDPQARGIVRDHLASAFDGQIRRFEAPLVRDDGRKGLASIVYAPVREQGEVQRVIAIARDVTDMRRTQSQLQQADKLAAMGQLVSGVAHEINNPAAIISGFAQTLMLDTMTTEQREMVEMIRDEAMRIGQITSNLLAFARMSANERTHIDVNELVRRTHALRAYYLGTLNVRVQLELDRDVPRVWGNVSELQQMLLNLIINAEHALAQTDKMRMISLRTRTAEREVRIECADTGPGIPPEIRERIFDPFFTTKPEGVGTGLGLSICYGIVQSHGGRVWVDSEPGNGATFVVVLPRDLRAEARPAPETTAAVDIPGGPITVLVVDDEPGIRQATARFLNKCGMQVRAAGDGTEALQALRTQAYDVILCDVRMPGMNGRDFLGQLRATQPELVATLMFTTGDTMDADTADLLADANVPALSKPFDFDELERLVRQVAARVRGRAPHPA